MTSRSQKNGPDLGISDGFKPGRPKHPEMQSSMQMIDFNGAPTARRHGRRGYFDVSSSSSNPPLIHAAPAHAHRRQLKRRDNTILTAGKTKRSVERRRVKDAELERFGMGKTLCEANIPQTGSFSLVRGRSGAQPKRSFVRDATKRS